jgi:hypothetical protein
VRVDVVDLLALDAGVLQRELDAGAHAEPVRAGVRHVVRVARDRAAEVLRQDRRAARLRVLQRLKHEHARALAHHEAVAILVVRARGLLRRVVEAGRHRAACDKARIADTAHRSLGAARHHHIGIAPLDQAHGVADRMGARRARGHHRMVRTLEAVFDRELARR